MRKSSKDCLTTFLKDFGVTELQLSLENEQNFIHNIIYYCGISSCIEELNEVKKGLEILGIFDLMKRRSDEAIIELKLCESQKSCDVLKLFGKMSYKEIKEGDRESNLQKGQEEDIYYNFTCFAEALEASKLNKNASY